MSKFTEYSNLKPDAVPLRALGLIVRPAQETDVAELARIAQEREGGEPAKHRRSLRSFLQGEGHILVADFEGEIVGFGKTAYLRQSEDNPPSCIPEGWYLAGVIVRPEFRRRGVGHELTRSRIEWLARKTSAISTSRVPRTTPQSPYTSVPASSELLGTSMLREFRSRVESGCCSS